MQSEACLCNGKNFCQRQGNAASIYIQMYIYIHNSDTSNTHSLHACDYTGLLICQHKHTLNKYSSSTSLHLRVRCWWNLCSWLVWSSFSPAPLSRASTTGVSLQSRSASPITVMFIFTGGGLGDFSTALWGSSRGPLMPSCCFPSEPPQLTVSKSSYCPCLSCSSRTAPDISILRKTNL